MRRAPVKAASGFLLVDVLVASAVLAVVISAVGSAFAAQNAARRRQVERLARARCVDESLVALAANPSFRNETCADDLAPIFSRR